MRNLRNLFRFSELRFKLTAGVAISDLSGIEEGYSLKPTEHEYSLLTVNLSSERFRETYLASAEQVRTPGFAVIDIPTNPRAPENLRKSPKDPFYREVYYLDGIVFAVYQLLFEEYGQFLIDDGMVNFGFGSHRGHDEVFVGPYKTLSIFADTPAKYVHVLESMGYRRRDPLKTVTDNISRKTPGTLTSEPVEGKSLFEVVEGLLQRGFYLAERREEP